MLIPWIRIGLTTAPKYEHHRDRSGDDGSLRAAGEERRCGGEYPFGSLVARGETVLAEGINHSVRETDESRHAEIIAIARARRIVGKKSLRDCTLYSTVEPCAMCSFCIRAAGIGRVVFALHSPVLGGMSRWDILQDKTLSRRLPFLFCPPPEIVTGISAEEVQKRMEQLESAGLAGNQTARLLCKAINRQASSPGGTAAFHIWTAASGHLCNALVRSLASSPHRKRIIKEIIIHFIYPLDGSRRGCAARTGPSRGLLRRRRPARAGSTGARNQNRRIVAPQSSRVLIRS